MKYQSLLICAGLILAGCNENSVQNETAKADGASKELAKPMGLVSLTPTYTQGFPEVLTVTGDHTEAGATPYHGTYQAGSGTPTAVNGTNNSFTFTGPVGVERSDLLYDVYDNNYHTVTNGLAINFIDSRNFTLPTHARIFTASGTFTGNGPILDTYVEVPAPHYSGHIGGLGAVNWWDGATNVRANNPEFMIPPATVESIKNYVAKCSYTGHATHQGTYTLKTIDGRDFTMDNLWFITGQPGSISLVAPHYNGHIDNTGTVKWFVRLSSGTFVQVSTSKTSYSPPIHYTNGYEDYKIECTYVLNGKAYTHKSNVFRVIWGQDNGN